LIAQFKHQLSSSLCLFLEHELLRQGQAYTNTTGTFYPSTNKKIDGINFSSSPAAQWVYDSSIDGAIIPSGVYLDSNFTPRDSTGVALNFINGGAYHSGNYAISGEYAQKDLNFYFRPEQDTELFVRKSFESKNPIDFISGSNDLNINAPCVIVNHRDSQNSPFAFGGHDETETNFQAVIISDNPYLLDGALSIFGDLNETCFPVIDFEDIPWGANGDLKGGDFNYTGLSLNYPNPNQQAFVDRVITNTVRQSSDGRNNFYLGYAEFRILFWRYPRV